MNEQQVSYREFARMTGFTDTAVRKAVISGKIKKGVTGLNTSSPQIIPSIASKEWGHPLLNDENLPEEEEEFDFTDGIPDGTSKAEADRMIAVYKAKKARLEYLETEGQLVDKGLVYTTLFNFANQVRDNLMNVPDRCIDNVLAADNRNASIIILGGEISKALTALSSTENIEFLHGR